MDRRRPFTKRIGVIALCYLLPAFILVAAFTYGPVLVGAGISFRNWNLSNLTNTDWNGFANYLRVIQTPEFLGILRNSVIWVVGSLIPQLVIGFAIALALRRKFRLRGLYQALAFFPWAVSGFLIGLLFRWLFSAEFGVVNDILMRLNLIDSPIPWLAQPGTAFTAAIIANTWYGVTFFAIMILAALQSIPDEVLEAAALDGANRFRQLFNIVIPYIRTTLLLTILLRVIWIFNFPDIIYAMTNGGPANQTHILTSWLIVTTQQGDYGFASALGVLVIGALAVFAVFYLLATRDRKVTK